jgi:hypothetical protein
METSQDRNAELKTQALYAVLNNIGNYISICLNDADFQRIRELKGNIDNMFNAAQKAIDESRFKAVTGMN